MRVLGWTAIGWVSVTACQLKVGTVDEGSGGLSASGGVAAANGGMASASGGALAASGGSENGNGGAVVASGGAGGSGASVVEDCASQAAENNDTREAAQLLGSGATLCVRGDEDWLYVDTPADGKAHILELLIAPDPGADVSFLAESSVDGSSLGSDYTQNGADETAWLTLGAGTRTLLRFTRFVKGGVVKLSATLTTEADVYSPNATRETAAKIEVNKPITAELHQPYTSSSERPYIDWFQADLVAGPHTLSFSHVPASRQVAVRVLDARGQVVANSYASNGGALLDVKFDAKSVGTYAVSVADFISAPGSFSVGAKPSALSDVYTFTLVE